MMDRTTKRVLARVASEVLSTVFGSFIFLAVLGTVGLLGFIIAKVATSLGAGWVYTGLAIVVVMFVGHIVGKELL